MPDWRTKLPEKYNQFMQEPICEDGGKYEVQTKIFFYYVYHFIMFSICKNHVNTINVAAALTRTAAAVKYMYYRIITKAWKNICLWSGYFWIFFISLVCLRSNDFCVEI